MQPVRNRSCISLLMVCALLLTACGFHLQGDIQLAAPLHRLYLQTNDPYGYLQRNLQQYLRMSHVELVSTPQEATTILAILSNTTSQELLSVNGTQQTQQYNLHATVSYQITKANGEVIIAPHSLTETRTITVQSNQILGSSNEANLFYQQMQRDLVARIINQIASSAITREVNAAFAKTVVSHEN
jgi:LPS-assembly lipoprotein